MSAVRNARKQNGTTSKAVFSKIHQVHMGKVDAVLTAPHTEDIDSEKCICMWFCIGCSNNK